MSSKRFNDGNSNKDDDGDSNKNSNNGTRNSNKYDVLIKHIKKTYIYIYA